MKEKRDKQSRAGDRLRRTPRSGPDAEPLAVPAHHLMCAVCARGGCKSPPPGKKAIDRLLKAMWDYPYMSLRILADIDVNRAHYFKEYEDRGRKPLPKNHKKRREDYVWRRKDLEVCRVLGILPNTEMPAFWVYSILFDRQPTLDGICRTGSEKSKAWPECPYARKGYYEKIAGERRYPHQLGEELDGKGIWAMIRHRTKEDMTGAKAKSGQYIMEKAERLYMRPQHILCLLCRPDKTHILIEDNLIEFLRRMEENPDIPVTLVEGCCEACDPCCEYHVGEHLCYHTHVKNSLRDLMILERLGLAPGATLPARELYQRTYERIKTLKEICGWRDGSSTAPYWAPCAYDASWLDDCRKEGLITGKPMA